MAKNRHRRLQQQASRALPPKNSEEKEQESSGPAANTNELDIVTAKAAQSAKTADVSSVKVADAGKKKNAPVKDSFIQEDYSMDIDNGDYDNPVDGGHDVTAKHVGKLCLLALG